MSETYSLICFEKTRDIGNTEGRNSKVYIARDKQLNAELVIKEISNLNTTEYFAESRMLYANQHPNIVPIQYASSIPGLTYLSMPYFPKGSLETLLKSRPISVRDILKYSIQILCALHAIHVNGLLHLDIKPTNILLDNAGNALLTDFGISKYMDPSDGVACASNVYNLHLYPEIILASSATIESDIYQLGLTIYRMCNGTKILETQAPTYKDLKKAIIEGNFPERSYFLPHIPKSLRKIIVKSLSLNLDDRYHSALEMINALSKVDKMLDWVRTDDEEKPYYLNSQSRTIEISIDSNRITTKSRANGQASERKMNRFCKSFTQNTKNRELYKVLEGISGELGQ